MDGKARRLAAGIIFPRYVNLDADCRDQEKIAWVQAVVWA